MFRLKLAPMLHLASAALLFGSIASAQQAAPQPDPGAKAPPPGAPAPMPPDGRPDGRQNGRNAGRDRKPDDHGPDQRGGDVREHAQEMRDRIMTRMSEFQGGGGGGFRGDSRIAPPGMWWKNPDLVAKLNLSADQQKRMDEIFLQFRIKLIHMKASLEEEQLMLEPLINANPPDSAKALAQINRIADTRADLEKANAAMLLGVRGVLTPDQWTRLQAEEKMHRRITIGRLGIPDRSRLSIDLNGAELAQLDGLPGELTIDLPSLENIVPDAAAMKHLEDTMKTMIPKMDLRLDELQIPDADLLP